MKLYPEATQLYLKSGNLTTESSRQSYKGMLRCLQNRHPNLHIEQFTAQHLTAFCLEPDLAPNTRRSRRSLLSGFFGWATYTNLIPADPSSTLVYSVKIRGGGVRKHTWMDDGQIRQLIQACGDSRSGRRMRVVLLLGLLLGLRRAEISKLLWSNLSSDLSSVTLVGKGEKLATLGVPQQLRAVLAEWRGSAPADAVYVIPLFSGDCGTTIRWDKRLSENSLSKLIVEHGQRAGVQIRPHDLRRTFAGMLDQRGMKVTDIQLLMRHSNLGTTSVYLEKNPRRVTQLAEGVSLDL